MCKGGFAEKRCFAVFVKILVLQLLFIPQILYTIGFASAESFNFTHLEFPKNFVFGAATASYQIEGAWNESGKGEKIWDNLTHTNPDAILDRSNGDIACNSYHKYKDDLQLLRDIGFQMYRFSLSWSRLFPDGYITTVNEDGIRYYNDLINGLLDRKIVPMVTLYHWDLPVALQSLGGWLNPNISDIFGEYARACFQHFGDRVKWWITINEPVLVTRGYGKKEFAPMLNIHGTGEYISGHNILKAHAKAYRIYDNEFRSTQGGKVSMAFFGNFYLAKNESSYSDIDAAERINQFTLGWFAHPIFTSEGDYPKVMREYVDKNSFAEGRNESRLPIFSQEEIEELKGSCDYFGLNHYSSKLAEFGIAGDNPSIDRDMEVITSADPTWPQTASSTFQVVPRGLRAALVWIKENYKSPDIFITENGYCDYGEIQDEERVAYHRDYMEEVSAAIKENGCKILGYIAWSLLDNFEWMKGYSVKYGLVQVDFNDPERSRKKKLSAQFFTELIQWHSRSTGVSLESKRLLLLLCTLSLYCFRIISF